MLTIEALTAASTPQLLSHARDLFGAYAGFLREIVACHGFNFDRFDVEILDLPHPYSDHGGELLLAHDASVPVGCVAFRAFEQPPASGFDGPVCELKRLFVLPSHRGQGIAERLVLTALDHARARGFQFAMLDTEPSTMQSAHKLYQRLGFTELDPRPPSTLPGIVFLTKALG